MGGHYNAAAVNLLVLGATGGSGRHIVSQALAAGHTVTVFVRDPAKAPAPHDRLRVVTGSLLDEAALTATVRGQDGVISAIGRGRSFKSEHLMEQVVPHLLSAMKAAGVRRLIFMSALGVGDSYQDSPIIGKLFFRTLLRGIYADKAVGDRLIRTSGLDWTLVQPSQLTDGPLTRNYRHGERLALSGIAQVSRADVADFILGCLIAPQTIGATLIVSN